MKRKLLAGVLSFAMLFSNTSLALATETSESVEKSVIETEGVTEEEVVFDKSVSTEVNEEPESVEAEPEIIMEDSVEVADELCGIIEHSNKADPSTTEVPAETSMTDDFISDNEKVESEKLYTESSDKDSSNVPLLETPKVSKVTNTTTGVKISWNSIEGAEKYRIFRKTGTKSWVKIGETTSTSYTDNNVSSGETYRYTLRCLSSDGSSYTSTYDKTGKSILYLARPKITALNNSPNGLQITWSKVTGATGYNIYRKEGTGSYVKAATIKGGTTVTYDDFPAPSLRRGKEYTYKVKAYNGSTTSASSSSKTYMRIGRPKMVTVENTAYGVKLTWGVVAGATGYEVYRNSTKIKTLTSNTKTTFFDNTEKTNGDKYIYTIRAINGNYKSYPAPLRGIYYMKAPVITGLINRYPGTATVTWNRNSNITGYLILYINGTTSKGLVVKGEASVSKLIQNLIPGTTCKVFVRSYKTVSGVNFYSPWSAAKSVVIAR